MHSKIVTENLVKHFGHVHAVEEISIHISRGEIYGFLGLNGAGKTTTIRMLLGMINPTSGKCYLNGHRVHSGSHSLWNQVGYLVEIPYSYPDLTVRENLDIFRRLRFISDKSAVDRVIEILQLGEYHNRKAKHLSLGNAQRLGLAKAMIHRPEILILDEPANGLDPAGIVDIRQMLLDLARNSGVTIFISSHILGEISKFANRIGIIHEGRLVHESDTHNLDQSRRRILHINTADNMAAAVILRSNNINPVLVTGSKIEIDDLSGIKNPAAINSLLVNAGYAPNLVNVEEEDLETYFLRVIGENGGVK